MQLEMTDEWIRTLQAEVALYDGEPWVADVPFERFKFYVLGMIGTRPGDALVLVWEPLREACAA
jgi:hypothetical protein